MEIRINETKNKVAIETGPSILAGQWFVFDDAHGGYYSNGEREEVDTWTVMQEPPPPESP